MKRTNRVAPLLAVAWMLSSVAAFPQSGGSLEPVLNQMDKAAASFRSAQTDFIWEQYQRVVEETDTQKGTMYVRHNGQNIEMAADIATDPPKYVLFKNGKVSVYQGGKPNQVTEYDAGKNKTEFESFLVLGFGGGGHEMAKSFDVRFTGNENIDGINAARLELKPKSERVRGMFDRILLWIDPARGLSVRQQFFQGISGDYRLVKYSNIQVNKKIDPDVFDLKKRTDSKTKYVRPNG